jgi:hypothetical protein
MKGAKDLLDSERGIFCLSVLVCVTILAAMKIITGADWTSLVKWLVLGLVASKTITYGKADPVAISPPTASS